MPVTHRRTRPSAAGASTRPAPVPPAGGPGSGVVTWTRLHLDPRHRRVADDLAAPTQLHRTLMALLPDALGPHPRQCAGLLYDLEADRDPDGGPSRGPRLLVQAWMPLDLTQLPPGYAHHTATRPLTPLLARLNTGRQVRYRITANTSASQPARDRHSRIVGLTGTAALAWWHARATHAGLTLHQAAATPVPFPRPHRNAPYHQLTRFDGTATVTCPDALTWAVQFGIGRARSYGAGLLQLATL